MELSCIPQRTGIRGQGPTAAEAATLTGYGPDMRTHLWILSGLVVGCTASKSRDTASSPAGDIVWAGWNHTWSKLSHRVSFIRAISTPEGGLEMGIRGGDWSTGDTFADDAAYRMHLQRVSGSDLDIVHGEATLVVGPDGAATTTQEVSVHGDVVDVVLRGFEIETDTDQVSDYPDYDPALGYTSRGFGMRLGTATQTTDGATFEVTALVRWGPRDREDMNAALRLAQTQVRVAWTAIGHTGSSQRSSVSDAEDLNHAPPYSPQSGLTLSTDLTGGTGIAGITGFDLGVRDQDGGDGGDYLRSFGVEVDLNEDASAPATLQAEVTTTSVIELGTMHFAPEVDVIWITPQSPDLAVEALTMQGIHEVGTFDIDPSL